MNLLPGIAALVSAVFLTWMSTPDITDHTIPVDLTTLVLRFGLTFILTFMAVSTLAKLRKKELGDQPTLDAE